MEKVKGYLDFLAILCYNDTVIKRTIFTLPPGRKCEAFVCVSLGLGRYALECLFFGGFMKKIENLYRYFSLGERILWLSSMALILVSFCLFDRSGVLSLIASLFGATALIFCAKGNPIGQMLMIVFAILYSIISFSYSYYGEMMTYLGMSLPMAVISLISWLRNPFQGKKSQVTVNRLHGKEFVFLIGLTGIVTVIFYFILAYFNTANLIPSTFSVTTSFFAAYLTFRRSPYFALAYALNDVVLIVLWVLALWEDPSYLSVVICFIVFLVNDSYSFLNWKRMERRQGMVL
jgi:nicotinamide mononucleotide transporter PnuC